MGIRCVATDRLAWRGDRLGAVKGYLFVADESGKEIPGSRRYLAHCRSREEYQAILRELEAAAGDGCMVLDSEKDRRSSAN